jgi:DNA-binding Xre family transcriptional regulator
MPPANFAPPVRDLSASGTLAQRVPRPTALYGAPSLRSLRLKRMLTQRELVEGAGVPRSVIAKLEAGGTARPATIRKLARFLEVEPEDLMAQPPAS